MADYSFWEVIKNGNKVLMKTVGTIEQTYETTFVEEKLDRKNEMKARGTLLMALPNKDQLKFHLYTNSTSNTNEADNTAYEVSTAHTQDKINILNLEVKLRDNDLVEYTKKLEKAEKERDELKLTLEKFQNSSKSLNNLLESQVSDKVKTGLGYKAASPVKESFVKSSKIVVKTVESKVKSVDVKNKGVYSTVETKPVKKNNFSPPIIKDWNSDDESEHDCDKRVLRPVWKNSRRANHKNFANKMTHPHPKRRFVPQAILTKSGKLNIAGTLANTVRPVNTADLKPIMYYSRPISNAFKKGYSQAIRPFNKYSAYKKTIFNKEVNAVKASAYSVWKAKHSSASNTFKKYSYVDTRGRSKSIRHMTRNNCYLTNYEDYDGGFVSFGDGKGRISRKGQIKTGTLDFDDVYFCKELKYNLFSVSQMCDKKNNVLFTNTEFLVLSSNFKLIDESQVLLRVPKKDNIYNVDLKSVVPTGGYSVVSKAMRVFNKRTRIVEETLNIRFLENAPNVKGNGPNWLFDIDFDNIYDLCASCKRKTRKRQNQIKTGQKQEAWQSPKKSKPITVKKERKMKKIQVQGTKRYKS
nr:ribonuclease H-like domain-containing protein [Tanacetum cinerariifolium]